MPSISCKVSQGAFVVNGFIFIRSHPYFKFEMFGVWILDDYHVLDDSTFNTSATSVEK